MAKRRKGGRKGKCEQALSTAMKGGKKTRAQKSAAMKAYHRCKHA